jgi:hypothetical protein
MMRAANEQLPVAANPQSTTPSLPAPTGEGVVDSTGAIIDQASHHSTPLTQTE